MLRSQCFLQWNMREYSRLQESWGADFPTSYAAEGVRRTNISFLETSKTSPMVRMTRSEATVEYGVAVQVEIGP
jgi:hypothetical protein